MVPPRRDRHVPMVIMPFVKANQQEQQEDELQRQQQQHVQLRQTPKRKLAPKNKRMPQPPKGPPPPALVRPKSPLRGPTVRLRRRTTREAECLTVTSDQTTWSRTREVQTYSSSSSVSLAEDAYHEADDGYVMVSADETSSDDPPPRRRGRVGYWGNPRRRRLR